MVKPLEKRIAVRFTQKDFWLYEDLKESADRSGWDMSKQIRAELAAARGKAVLPVLPEGLSGQGSFSRPPQETPGRRRRKAA